MGVRSLVLHMSLLRMDRMIGNWLLLWPTLSALCLAGATIENWWIVSIFSLGVFLTRALGCVINDICDREFDAQVKRTQLRPLANRSLSFNVAIAWLLVLSVACFSLLTQLRFNTICVALVAACLVCIYPLTKRFFYFPQLFLGITFSMGIPMAFYELQGFLSINAVLFYLATVIWIVGFDTLYALADVDDDLKVGLHSSAVWLGDRAIEFVSCCYVLTVLLWLSLLIREGAQFISYVLMAMIVFLFKHQLDMIKQDMSSAIAAFKLNHLVGAFYYLALLIGSSTNLL